MLWLAQVGVEPVRRRGPHAPVRKEDAIVQKQGLPHRSQRLKEALQAHRFQVVAQQTTYLVPGLASTSPHAPLLGEDTGAAGRLPLQVAPGCRADAPGNQDRCVAVEHQGLSCIQVRQVQRQAVQVGSRMRSGTWM